MTLLGYKMHLYCLVYADSIVCLPSKEPFILKEIDCKYKKKVGNTYNEHN